VYMAAYYTHKACIRGINIEREQQHRQRAAQ